MREHKQLLSNEEFLILQCSIAREEDLKNVDPASIVVFFEKVKEKTDHEVQEMTLPVVSDPPTVTKSDQVSACSWECVLITVCYSLQYPKNTF